MRLNCKGFMLPDYLLSFTIWLLIALTWMPVYVHVLKQLEDSEHSKLVNELFYNHLIELKLGKWKEEIRLLKTKVRATRLSGKKIVLSVCNIKMYFKKTKKSVKCGKND